MKEPKMYRVILEDVIPSYDEMIKVVFESDNYEEAKEYFDSHKPSKNSFYVALLQERDYRYKTIEKGQTTILFLLDL